MTSFDGPVSRRAGPFWRRAFVAFVVAGLDPVAASAQQPEPWNSARALELISRARERRAEPLADSLLENYRAKAAGMVYFYLDRRSSEERTLVRSDQIALEVYWAAPDRTKQRIIGMRGEDALPNRMHYHLDHLTVVQNEFDDVIRMGDGDEVHDVPHPAAPGSESVYDFRIADSLAIRLPGAPEPVLAYQIDVRPKESERSALIGSVFVDRATADVVRMTFTFTPASYVDRRLDYINVSLDNSLWNGRYWLPYEQAVEIRRQIPELDFIAGAVIQARFRVSGYEFNQELRPGLFDQFPVTAVPPEQRESYAFESTLYDDLIDTGLAAPAHMRDIRAQAAALVRERALSGLPPLRPTLPDASSALRYNRAEGPFLGAGLSYQPGPSFRASLTGGHAFTAHRGTAELGLRWGAETAATQVQANVYYNALRDIGLRPGMPGALNTISAIGLGDDYLDPFRARGAGISVRQRVSPRWTLGLGVAGEHHSSADLVAETVVFDDDASFRPVRPVDEGRLVVARATASRSMPGSAAVEWAGEAAVEAGTFEGDVFARPTAELALRRQSLDLRTTAQLRATAGVAIGSPAAQQLFLLGGRGTLPGYPYRSFLGDAFALADVELTRQIAAPWLGVRLLGAAGLVGWLEDEPDRTASLPGGAEPAWTRWSTRPTGGIQSSVGAGFSLLYDTAHLDLVRGLNNGGEWQLLFSITPRFSSML